MGHAQWSDKSYSRRLLWQIVIGSFILAIAGAYAVDFVHQRWTEDHHPDIDLLNEQFRQAIEQFDPSIFLLSIARPEQETSQSLITFLTKLSPDEMCLWLEHIARHHNDQDLKLIKSIMVLDDGAYEYLKLYRALWTSLPIKPHDATLPVQLGQLLEADPISRYAHFAVGVYWLHHHQIDPAIEAYWAEAEQYDADYAREQVVTICFAYERYDAMAKWVSDPSYQPLLTEHDRIVIHAGNGNWWVVFWRVPILVWGDVSPYLAVLSLIVGSFWFVFLILASQPGDALPRRIGLGIAAVCLGILSVWPTIFMAIWQEYAWGLIEGETPISKVLFYILGVGLREELAKALLVLPLVPWLAKRDDGLCMLLISACVGLGFAVEENMQYYDRFEMGSIAGRFLTANIMHMMLTGWVGMELCWLWRYPRKRAVEFVSVFALAVIGHGAYDVAFDLVDPQDMFLMSIAPYVILLLIVYRFFHLIRSYRQPSQQGVSLMFVYTLGVCVSGLVMVWLQSWLLGPAEAFTTISQEVMFMGIMSVVMFQQIPQSLRD